MSNENLFKEIEEDLERQRYEDLWKRYGMYVIAVAVAIVVGTGAYNMWQTHNAKMNQMATGELANIMDRSKADPTKRIAALDEFAQDNHQQTQAVFAELQAAADAAAQGNNDQAIKIYDAVANDDKADHAFRQLAALRSVGLQLDAGDPAVLQKKLEPLMGENEPWHATAMEYSGFLAYRAGDKEKAKDVFTKLSQDASVPQSLSARATEMLRVVAE